ncbi:hypothetical protein [Nocardia sp. SC052]|uniref:hypothetical protein n=1 Tax=Nocardia sichangensis TaxID=3385975 RepID=UPI0039A1DE60
MSPRPIPTCTTCGKPADPHPYRHPITVWQKPEHPPEGRAGISPSGLVGLSDATVTSSSPDPCGISPQAAPEHTTEVVSARVPLADYDKAMRLLDLDPDRALVTVHIEHGVITATYTELSKVGTPIPTET